MKPGLSGVMASLRWLCDSSSRKPERDCDAAVGRLSDPLGAEAEANVKALFRRAKALSRSSDFGAARRDLPDYGTGLALRSQAARFCADGGKKSSGGWEHFKPKAGTGKPAKPGAPGDPAFRK